MSDLFQDGTKCAKLSFRVGAVCSVCVRKVGHHAFDLEWTLHDRVVEEGEQLFRRKTQPPHPGFDLEVNRVRGRMRTSGLGQGGKDAPIADDRRQPVSDQVGHLFLKERSQNYDRR